MTTFFFNESIDQELDLDGLSSVNGGMSPGLAVAATLGLAGGIAVAGIGAASLIVDVANGDDLGTAAGEMIDKLSE